MRVLVMGDISGGGGYYHVGDEAMSEVAVQQLQQRGAEVTIVADKPEISAPLYGVAAVQRFELWREGSRAKKISRMDLIMRGVRGQEALPTGVERLVLAIREADAVVIAGGGNLNSHLTDNHLLERVLLARVAKHYGVPLYVSSQTVGPALTTRDKELVREIACYARAFGARESSTAELMRQICGGEAVVVHTMDDAILMDLPSEAATENEKRTYIVASFTVDAGATGLDTDSYYRTVAAMLDRIIEANDVDVVLLPHIGRLGSDNSRLRNSDVFAHERIAEYSAFDRITVKEMMRAEELVAVTAGARLALSTRYHPAVFGSVAGVPSVCLVTSWYSAVRMRGALKNVGLESLAIPFETWVGGFDTQMILALGEHADAVRAHLRSVCALQRTFQTAWWDGIVADIRQTGSVATGDLVVPRSFEWGEDVDQRLLALARGGQEHANRFRMDAELAAATQAQTTDDLRDGLGSLSANSAAMSADVSSIHGELAVLSGRLAVADAELARMRQELALVRHKQRPIGASLRDWIAAKRTKKG